MNVNVTAAAAPTLLTPTNGSYLNDGGVTGTWAPVAGASLYNIQISTTPTFSSYYEDFPSTTTYTAVPDLPDGHYYWRVSAFDGAWGPWSTVWDFYVDTTPPSAPVLYDPTNTEEINDTTPLLDWNYVSGCSNYNIRIDNDSDMSSPHTDTTTGISTYYQVASALPEGNQYWDVRARDLAGNWGPRSSIWSFNIDITPPASTSLLSPTSGYVGNSITLECNTASGATYYRFDVATDVTMTNIVFSEIDTLTTNSPTLADGTYYWRVVTVDLAGNMALSAIWQFTLDTAGPEEVVLFGPEDGNYITDTTPLLDWYDVGDAEYYQVQVDTTDVFADPDVDSLTVSSHHTTSELVEDTYYWRVRARDDAENFGNWSEIWTFTIDLTAPDAPTVITPSNNSIISDNTPFLNWTIIGDAVEYEFELATEETFGASTLFTTTTVNNYYTILFTLDDDDYYIRIRAKDAAENWGNWSEMSIFTVDTVVVPEFNNLVLKIPLIAIIGLVALLGLRRKKL